MHQTVFERSAPTPAQIDESLSSSRPAVFWLEDAPGARFDRLSGAIDTDLVIVFDTSGSMGDHVPGGRKLDIAKAAMWKFVDSLPKSVSVGLVVVAGGELEPDRVLTEAHRTMLRARGEGPGRFGP